MYYPKSRVITDLIAKPGEIKEFSGKEYTGKYWITYDGRYFKGDYPNDNAEELFKIEKFILPTNKIIKNSINEKLLKINPFISVTNMEDPKPYYPNPTVDDYKKGTITRYFAKERKIRTYKILEINRSTYDDIKKREGKYNYSKWDVTSIIWKISGPLYSTFNGNIITRAGVLDTNERIVKNENKEFIGINKYLTNFKEFYKE